MTENASGEKKRNEFRSEMSWEKIYEETASYRELYHTWLLWTTVFAVVLREVHCGRAKHKFAQLNGRSYASRHNCVTTYHSQVWNNGHLLPAQIEKMPEKIAKILLSFQMQSHLLFFRQGCGVVKAECWQATLSRKFRKKSCEIWKAELTKREKTETIRNNDRW